jgi:D-glycero-alpha-D-manno-heptose-7-phosphate kinase
MLYANYQILGGKIMIITRTPFRISFVGGGTDIESYYKNGYGAVVNATIDKYMYITVNKRFDDSIRISYSKTEIVDNVDEIQHEIVREALKLVGITKGIEITSISDIPSGTGLGSSSSFTVGLLNALYTYIGDQKSAHEIAELACKLEIDILKHPIGKQDQFAAAYGGLNYFKFNADGSVDYKPIKLSDDDYVKLNEKLSMWYTGINRSADDILIQQNDNIENKINVLNFMRDQANSVYQKLNNLGFFDDFGLVLHEGWIKKKTLTESISNSILDYQYNIALKNGAQGGKILGAGGGGFFLFYSEIDKISKIKLALKLNEMHFRITNHGSRVVYFSED